MKIRKSIQKIGLNYKNKPHEWEFSSLLLAKLKHKTLSIEIELNIFRSILGENEPCELHLDGYFCELNELEQNFLNSIFISDIKNYQTQKSARIQKERKESINKNLKQVLKNL